MNKEKLLRILFIEDLLTDMELAVKELEKAGIQFTYMRVETKDMFLKALDDFKPDIVISDFALPAFDGMHALQLTIEHDKFLPFIVLTGSMNEDTAVACIKSGAIDYVIKEHLTRLPFAVIEALEQKNLQKKKDTTEKSLIKSEIKYRGIFENIQDVYYEVLMNGKIIEVSPSIEILSKGQYKREDLIGESISKIYFEQKARDNLMSVLIKNNKISDYEIVFKNRDGLPIPCSVSSIIQLNEKLRPERIIGTIRDITFRKKNEVLLLKRARELAINQEATISSMAILAEYRDLETGAHIQRTKFYVKLLLEKLGDKTPYSPEIIELIWHSASLHDIGKVGIPDSILLKPGKLTAEEFEQIKKHTVIGSDVIRRTERILGEASFLNFALEITEFHHEKWNGTGYPHGLKGTDIPLSARIMAIADVYDAIISKRPYKDPMTHQQAVQIIHNDSGTHFDPMLEKIFEDSNLEFDKIAKQYKD